jgi:hypothetical protein
MPIAKETLFILKFKYIGQGQAFEARFSFIDSEKKKQNNQSITLAHSMRNSKLTFQGIDKRYQVYSQLESLSFYKMYIRWKRVV